MREQARFLGFWGCARITFLGRRSNAGVHLKVQSGGITPSMPFITTAAVRGWTLIPKHPCKQHFVWRVWKSLKRTGKRARVGLHQVEGRIIHPLYERKPHPADTAINPRRMRPARKAGSQNLCCLGPSRTVGEIRKTF